MSGMRIKLVGVAAAVLLLSGCGGAVTEATETSSPTPSATTTPMPTTSKFAQDVATIDTVLTQADIDSMGKAAVLFPELVKHYCYPSATAGQTQWLDGIQQSMTSVATTVGSTTAEVHNALESYVRAVKNVCPTD